MAQPPPDAAAPVRMRIRSRHACDSCRKRNRRCSGMQPCAECTGYGYECIFSSQSSRSSTSMGLEVTDYHGDGRHTVMNSAQVIPLRIGGEVDVIDHGTVVLRPPTLGGGQRIPQRPNQTKRDSRTRAVPLRFPETWE